MTTKAEKAVQDCMEDMIEFLTDRIGPSADSQILVGLFKRLAEAIAVEVVARKIH